MFKEPSGLVLGHSLLGLLSVQSLGLLRGGGVSLCDFTALKKVPCLSV